MKYIEIFSSTWAGTEQSEKIPLEEFGYNEDVTEEDIYDDEDSIDDIRNVAEQQQHFEWGFKIVDE